jgi:hypothetical protein
MTPLILVVDDEPDVEVLFRQQFRRLGAVRFKQLKYPRPRLRHRRHPGIERNGGTSQAL